MSEVPEPIERIEPARFALAIVAGLLAGAAFVLAPYLLWRLVAIARGAGASGPLTSVSGFNLALTALFPLVQGLASGLALGPKRHGAVSAGLVVLVLALIEILGAWALLHEGVICIIILSPFILVLMLAGVGLGRLLARRNASPVLRASLIPLVVLAVAGEAAGPKPDYAAAVVDSVVIDAPPDYVWRYVASYPENRAPPHYWLWRVGLPYPIQSVAEAPRVGAARVCRFSDGIVFDERIVGLKPNEVMTFEVTKQPDHPEVTGHFQFERGQIRLKANADGTTTVTASSWYRLFVRPGVYFNWWTADITRQVHFRVLGHVKALAERDYRSRAAPQPPI